MNMLQYPLSMEVIFKEEDLRARTELKKCNSELSVCFPEIFYYLSCSPNGSPNSPTKAGIYLHLIGNEKVFGEYTISIPSADFFFKCSPMFSGPTGYGAVLCDKNSLYGPEKRFFVNGKMTVKVDGMLILTLPTRRVCNFSCRMEDDSIGQRLWEKDDKDFAFVVETEKIKVHKWVLSACSPVFNKMLQNEWKEAKDNEVEIPDFDLKTVTMGLQFSYDIFPKDLTCEEAIELLKFADKYDIKKLHIQIQEFLALKISNTNVCEIANETISTNAIELRKSCLAFLRICLIERFNVDNIASLGFELKNDLLMNAFSGL